MEIFFILLVVGKYLQSLCLSVLIYDSSCEFRSLEMLCTYSISIFSITSIDLYIYIHVYIHI